MPIKWRSYAKMFCQVYGFSLRYSVMFSFLIKCNTWDSLPCRSYLSRFLISLFVHICLFYILQGRYLLEYIRNRYNSTHFIRFFANDLSFIFNLWTNIKLGINKSLGFDCLQKEAEPPIMMGLRFMA